MLGRVTPDTQNKVKLNTINDINLEIRSMWRKTNNMHELIEKQNHIQTILVEQLGTQPHLQQSHAWLGHLESRARQSRSSKSLNYALHKALQWSIILGSDKQSMPNFTALARQNTKKLQRDFWN